ncbi:MAG: leucine-rich repeat domain-containing protein [Chloroflexi bacterium]|nr:leucine-rich repeat domain-containing protein [Chloroflexota bacterium]
MKTKLSLQWIVRMLLILVVTGDILSIPAQLASAKPLTAPFTNCAAQTEIPQMECEALTALYDSTNGVTWWNKTNWLQTNTPCDWHGVTCDGGYVTSIVLEENGLNGPIPPELGNLGSLASLNLWNNQISGAIPIQLSNLENLTLLHLGDNDVNGFIPQELGNLASLIKLDLSGNRLSGSIPPELGNLTSLEWLDLGSNQLSGIVPIQLGDLTNLTDLSLTNNQISGSIPSQLGDLTNLEYLDLSINQLSGPIPLQLGDLTYLLGLDLEANQLSGPIPLQLGNLTNLSSLQLGSNQLNGSIPVSLGNLSNLSWLGLYNNHLSGSIPPQLGNLTYLGILGLSDNQLSGSIPTEIGNLTNLTMLSLHNNQLTGSLPPQIGNLANLQWANLTYNQLSGSIPSQIGNLTHLQHLELDKNQLSGEFPTSITNLTGLYYFKFDQCAGLTSNDADVITFLSQFAPNWNICDQDMSVKRIGSAIVVPVGDATPSFAEGTNFGGVGIDKARGFDFDIFNNGSIKPLRLTGGPIVTISGDPSFSVRTQPQPASEVQPGAATRFRIRFSPKSLGLHTAIISIANDDADKNPYIFTVQGVGARYDAYESDNDFASARTIIPGVSQTHSIFPMGDRDHVKFTLTAPSNVVLETSGVDGYDTEIALYDANHNLVGYDNDGGDFLYSRLARTCLNALPAGEYYLKTYVYEGVIPEYQLDLKIVPCVTAVRASHKSTSFTVTFSEPVIGVDMVSPQFDDFTLVTSPGISGASITDVNGSGATYVVKVNAGSGAGMIRLDVPVTATITDLDGNPLANLPFTSGETYTLSTTSFFSSATNDGWTLESSEYSSRANAKDNSGHLLVGDNAKNRQYRSLLYFDTSSLPNDATVIEATLKIKLADVTAGTDPFSTHGSLFAEMKNGIFGKSPLENTDFQAVAYPKRSLGNFIPVDGEAGWYQLVLNPANFKYVNVNGVTQFRIRFTKDDDNDKVADFISFYSGDDATNPPQLIIEYTTP